MSGVGRAAWSRLAARALLTAGVAAGILAGAPAATQPADSGEGIFAVVGGETLTRRQLSYAYYRTVRRQYYHGAPPERELADLHQRVADELIARTLLLQEARRLGVGHDEAQVAAELERYTARYSGSAGWREREHQVRPVLAAFLAEEATLRRFESRVRSIGEPDEQQLRAFYAANPGKFTEPARHRVSLILLRVAPGAPGEAWQAALAEGASLVAKLRAGADFADLARLHSADASAAAGGDMGYLHAGMIGPPAREVVEALAPGETSDPLRLLEGVAVLRVEDRTAPRLRDFDSVRERAAGLWAREQGEQAWQALQRRLRASTPVEIHDTRIVEQRASARLGG